MHTTKVTIMSISEILQVTEKFKKVETVVETDEKYPQTLLVEWANNASDQIAQFSVGDIVEIKYNVRGRAWQSPSGEVKYFHSLSGWEMFLISPAKTPESKGPSLEEAEAADDLPF